MMIPFLPPAVLNGVTNHATSFALQFRGGAAAAAFDVGMAKTRLEGLAYGTVTALVMQAALHLLKAVDGDNRKLVPLPVDNNKQRNKVLLNNVLKVTFGVLLASTVSLGLYTTAVFTIMSIYSKTALGMGHTDDFTKFFNACAKFRDYGFRSFVGSLASFGMSWVCALLLTYDNDENELRWWVALPAILVAAMSFLHYKELFALASTFVYSG